jgi:two-component system, OmpR family, phosphate regulon response regulator OmpR
VSRGHVLIVEDDDHVVTMLRALLEVDGYEVTEAGDGLLGLIKLATGGADAVLLDVMMPDLDGVRVLEQLLEEHGEVPVPVLVITGSPDGADRCRALIGSDDVFEKPFDPRHLLARLQVRLTNA